VIADLRGKGGRVRTVAVPVWVKQAVNAWTTAAAIEEGKLLRAVLKCGKVVSESLSDWAVWSVVETSAREIGIERFGAHDLRRTCAKLCARMAAIWSKSSSCSVTRRSRGRNATLGQSRRSP
jgi:integrase